MQDNLLAAATAFAQAHPAHADGGAAMITPTPVPGLLIVRATTPGAIDHSILRPLVAIVLQGRKVVARGTERAAMQPGMSMLVTADIPTVSQIVEASRETPYCSIVLDLDPAVIASLTAALDDAAPVDGRDLRAAPTGAELADTALRLLRLLDRPGPLSVLGAQLVREMHYWLLVGEHGGAVRRLGQPDGAHARIGRAVERLRADFDRTLRVGDLAAVAGMSPSAFHRHFRAVTSLTPIQFQKQLRLIEARRRMLADGERASSVAFSVGYESLQQFTREYGRMFGAPPARDIATLRGDGVPAAAEGAAA